MNVSNEQQVIEEAVVRALRATRANDAETAPRRHRRQTPQCPSIARFASVRRGQQDNWTEEEKRHVGGCPFCQNLSRLFTVAIAEAAVAAAREDTVMNVDTSQETQTGLSTAPGAKKSGKPSKPATGE